MLLLRPAVLLSLLIAAARAVLPPGYEDFAWCPPGSCLRDVYNPRPGQSSGRNPLGPTQLTKECFNVDTGVVVDEVWTGSGHSVQAPPGWVIVQAMVDVQPPIEPNLCPEGGPYGLPRLPDQFETWVTCNIVDRNLTTVIHEVYDAPNNRALFSRYLAHGAQDTTLYLYDQDEYIHMNKTSCAGGQLSDLGYKFGLSFQSAMTGHDGRIAGTAEFLRFAADGQQEQYMGVYDVAGMVGGRALERPAVVAIVLLLLLLLQLATRGREHARACRLLTRTVARLSPPQPCERYQSITNTPPTPHHGGSHMTLDYYFSSPGW